MSLKEVFLLCIRTSATSQAVSENLPLKQQIFGSLAKEVSPAAILASNTSSLSLTKIAAATIAPDVSAASDKGKANASRVVGKKIPSFEDQSLTRPLH